MELPEHPPASHSTPNEDVDMDPPASDILTDYSEEHSGIYGLDSKWYKKPDFPFLQTPQGAAGIYAHSEFLNKHEHEMSSPSRGVSNRKFRKGSEMAAYKGEIAQGQLGEKTLEDVWSSQNLFVNEGQGNRHVKPHHGGRVMTVRDAIRTIKDRNDIEEATEIEKAEKEAKAAALKLEIAKYKLVKDKEKADRALMKMDEEADKARKRAERGRKTAQNKKIKDDKANALHEKWMDAIAAGKRPKGRMPKSVQEFWGTGLTGKEEYEEEFEEEEAGDDKDEDKEEETDYGSDIGMEDQVVIELD